jgi:hypothetical protein
MAQSLEAFARLVEAEYAWLRQRLGLREVKVEVVVDNTPRFPCYGGEPRRIVMPMTQMDLSVVHDYSPTVAPEDWRLEAWDPWRVFLWHEVAHQLQDEHGYGWNPSDGWKGHSEPTWSRVVDEFASGVGCPDARALYRLLASTDTASYAEVRQ